MCLGGQHHKWFQVYILPDCGKGQALFGLGPKWAKPSQSIWLHGSLSMSACLSVLGPRGPTHIQSVPPVVV